MNRERFQFGLCSRVVRRKGCVLLISLLGVGCAGPPLVAGGLGYPGATRPGVATGPTPAKPPSAVPPPTVPAAPAVPAGNAGAAAAASPIFDGTPFGGDGPLLLERADANAHWLAVCRAGSAAVHAARGERHVDALERVLLTPQEELGIDGLLTSDATGRFALVMQRGALVLRDNHARSMLDLSALGADARLSAESFAELRTASFDASSEHLLYVRSGQQGQRVVIRALSDGSERELDPGPGVIWRARFDVGGVFAVLEMLTNDSNKNGRADFPAPLLIAPRACSPNPARFHTWAERGDRPETVLLPLDGGAPIHEPDLLMPVRDALLLRDGAGALLLQRAGKKRLLEPAGCKGRIVHADALRELFVVGCVQKKRTGRVSLELVTRTERKPLDIELASVELDRPVGDSARLVPLYPGLDSALFDAERREVLPLQTGDVVVMARAGRALVRRGKALLVYDVDTHSEEPLLGTVDRFPDVLVAAPFAFVSPLLVDLDHATSVVVDLPRPLALSNTGQLLVAATPADGATLARGPLRWVSLSQ